MIDEKYVGQIETVMKTVNTDEKRPYTSGARTNGKSIEQLPESYNGQLDKVVKTVRMG